MQANVFFSACYGAMAKRKCAVEEDVESKAMRLGLLSKDGVRICCTEGRHQCHRVLTANQRHRPGSRKHSKTCVFLWQLVRSHVAAGEDFLGHDDMSMEEAVGETIKARTITFDAPQYVADKDKFDAVALKRVQEIEGEFRVKNTALFRSWLYFHWQWLAKQARSPMKDCFRSWVGEHLEPLTAVQEQVLLRFCPASAISALRRRGRFAVNETKQHAPNLATWFVFIVVFRYCGSETILTDAFFQHAAPCLCEDNVQDVVRDLTLQLLQARRFRTTLAAWFSTTDGRRRSFTRATLTERKVPCTGFGILDNILGALPNWVEVSLGVAAKFQALQAAIVSKTFDGVETACRCFMRSILDYELVGLKLPVHAEFGTWSTLQVYAAKFILTDSFCRLRQCCPEKLAVLDRLAKRHCFWGPSPRILYEELGVKLEPLEWFRRLATDVPEMDTELYALQMSPCEWRLWLTLCKKFEGIAEITAELTEDRRQKLWLQRLEGERIELFLRLLRESGLCVSCEDQDQLYEAFNPALLLQGKSAVPAVKTFKLFVARFLEKHHRPRR